MGEDQADPVAVLDHRTKRLNVIPGWYLFAGNDYGLVVNKAAEQNKPAIHQITSFLTAEKCAGTL
jgi:hypothetical protein